MKDPNVRAQVHAIDQLGSEKKKVLDDLGKRVETEINVLVSSGSVTALDLHFVFSAHF